MAATLALWKSRISLSELDLVGAHLASSSINCWSCSFATFLGADAVDREVLDRPLGCEDRNRRPGCSHMAVSNIAHGAPRGRRWSAVAVRSGRTAAVEEEGAHHGAHHERQQGRRSKRARCHVMASSMWGEPAEPTLLRPSRQGARSRPRGRLPRCRSAERPALARPIARMSFDAMRRYLALLGDQHQLRIVRHLRQPTTWPLRSERLDVDDADAAA